MVRDNSNRIGDVPQDDLGVPPQIINTSQTSYIQPTEMVSLPTHGRFYPKDHVLHGLENIEIRHMTTKDEEILNSRTLLQKGVALDKMLQGLIINPAIKVEDLFLSDKNALILCARITGYDNEYKPSITCPTCGEKTATTFDLNEVKAKEAAEDITLSDDGTFDITLKKSKAVLTLRLLKGVDEKALKMESDKKKKHNLPETPIQDQLRKIIIAVNNDTDGEVVNKFVNSMFALDSHYLRNEYARIIPNLDLTRDFECSKCFSSNTITIPFNSPEFFWPK